MPKDRINLFKIHTEKKVGFVVSGHSLVLATAELVSISATRIHTNFLVNAHLHLI